MIVYYLLTINSTESFGVFSWSLPKFISIASVTPSGHLILWCPLLLLPSIFPSIRDFSKELSVHIRWPKYWSFSFSIGSSNEYSGLISLKIDWFDLLAVQGLSRVFSSTTVRRHQFFGALPSLWSSSQNHTRPPGPCCPRDSQESSKFASSYLASLLP